MSTDRFHKAARDGLLDILKEATRKECNGRDETGTTPTLWAAFEGHLDALRLLCGRGGDPDKADYFGNTALHLAAARGHKECVTFLVNFGANLYSVDIDNHTAQELAAINNRDDILRFLDTATAKLENTDKKKAKHMKEIAKKNSVKHLKQYAKRQTKADLMEEKEMKKYNKEWEATQEDIKVQVMPHRPSTVLMAIKQKMLRSSSQGNLLTSFDEQRPTYSALVGTISSTGHRGKSAVQKKALASKLRNGTLTKNDNDEFKIRETEVTGKRSVKSLTGMRRDSEVIYVGTFSNPSGDGPQRGKLMDIFTSADENTNQTNGMTPRKSLLTRSASQPDFLADDCGLGQEVMLQEPASIFERPGFGSVAFRRSITATLSALPATPPTQGEDLSIGSAGSLAARQRSQQQNWERDALSESSEGSDDEDGEEAGFAALDRFLAAWGLSQYVDKFKQEQIDLDALLLLTENDLKSLGLPLGPYRKLATAIQDRKNALSNPGAIIDAAL